MRPSSDTSPPDPLHVGPRSSASSPASHMFINTFIGPMDQWESGLSTGTEPLDPSGSLGCPLGLGLWIPVGASSSSNCRQECKGCPIMDDSEVGSAASAIVRQSAVRRLDQRAHKASVGRGSGLC
ncbi:unnamed protein product [Pleuronectes platessa]|uniref:Uncharacterized protein n=1 Tax=Pleuronectes platessa TaxID=8262 RepID=A0A9N7UXE5_PLEPL|nr:unnamed protein product [Pleuronectes platessa]